MTGPTFDVRAAVWKRALDACERCGGTACLQVHHRRPRRMGGSRDPATNMPGNLLLLCGDCHLGWAEKHRTQALADGYLVHAEHDPARVPVKVFRLGFVLLADDGTYQSVK